MVPVKTIRLSRMVANSSSFSSRKNVEVIRENDVQVSRAAVLSFASEHVYSLDILALFNGSGRKVLDSRSTVRSPHVGKSVSISNSVATYLIAWPPAETRLASDVCEEAGIDESDFDGLVDAGIVSLRGRRISDQAGPSRDSGVGRLAWDYDALNYMAASRWGDKKTRKKPVPAGEEQAKLERKSIARWISKYGKPPPEFHTRVGTPVDLPAGEREGGVFDALADRATIRLFDEERQLDRADLASALHYGFGWHGDERPHEDLRLLKKYNPSGGALHAIEAYPLVLNVEGLAPGLYHYRAENHSLTLLKSLSLEGAKNFAEKSLSGQSWYRTAHVVVFMTARFERAFWKYRNHSKAYKSIVMDSGHISQTLYLIASELGLGAFVTMALNDLFLESELDIYFMREGLIAACGLGVRRPSEDEFKFDFEPRGASSG